MLQLVDLFLCYSCNTSFFDLLLDLDDNAELFSSEDADGKRFLFLLLIHLGLDRLKLVKKYGSVALTFLLK